MTYKVFYSTPMDVDEGYKALEHIMVRAVNIVNKEGRYKVELQLTSQLSFGNFVGEILRHIQEADLIICNISSWNRNAMYELGAAHGLNKPTLGLINNEAHLPFDLFGVRYVTFDSQMVLLEDDTFVNTLAKTMSGCIIEALDNPSNWQIQSLRQHFEKKQKTVFVSYSHKDYYYLDRLKVHLKPLERKGLIQLWSDTLILSGEKWKEKIESALNNSVIAILLISADFLSSEFIVNNELQVLLKHAEQKGTIIIPIILKPCRFLRELSISQFQSINDPLSPLCKLLEWEQEGIYEKVSQRIEMALDAEK